MTDSGRELPGTGAVFWVLRAITPDGVTTEDFQTGVEAHLAWLRNLERRGTVLLAGPLIDGPGIVPGHGLIIVRAKSRQEAEGIAAQDPIVLAGHRRFEVYRWQLNEGAPRITLSLSEGTAELS